jgi:hypothetical protein
VNQTSQAAQRTEGAAVVRTASELAALGHRGPTRGQGRTGGWRAGGREGQPVEWRFAAAGKSA